MALPARVRCIVAGGGPAGLVAGYLLARAGIEVLVLEKHADFLRDFRGDTIHPSTTDVLAELGLLDAFLALPHQEVRHAEIEIAGQRIRLADFSRLPTRCKFIAFMPQWDFLNFMAAEAQRYPAFHLAMRAEATGLVEEAGRIAGVHVATPEGQATVRADLVIAADGRHSTIRRLAGLETEAFAAPMDVLWFKLDKRGGDESAVLGRVDVGQAMIMLDRGDYWQSALIIRKGTAEQIKAQGLDAFRDRIAKLTRRQSVDEIRSLEDVKLLTVTVDRLARWHRPGLLCIGDAAHAMSPVGGVGINLAIQDAIAAVNTLAEPLRRGSVTEADLARVQKRRMFPTRATQRLQITAQNRVIGPILSGTKAPSVPWIVRLVGRLPFLQGLAARAIGIGFRPEHVDLKVIDGGPAPPPSAAPPAAR